MKNDSIQILRDFILESRAEISSEYKKKENLRISIQDILQDSIASGEISSKEDLVEWWKTFDMSSNTLKSVPFEVWKMMSK